MRRPLALAVALVLASSPAVALADGDPASDILLGQDVFYPYAPNVVSKPLQVALNSMVRTAKREGFAVKVAVIASAGDLGSVPQLLDEPQRYADLLTQEIAFNAKPRVLVVLPSGIGGNNLGDNAGTALRPVVVPPGASADALAQTALKALGRLTAAAGKPVPVPHVSIASKAKKKSSTSPLIVFGVPVLLVAIAAAIAAARSRRHQDDETEQTQP